MKTVVHRKLEKLSNLIFAKFPKNKYYFLTRLIYIEAKQQRNVKAITQLV